MLRTALVAMVVAACFPVSARAALTYDAPAQWKPQPASSSMRLAQFVLTRADGDAEDATAVIFFFGKGQGGGVDDNLERWASQMVQPGGKPGTRQQAKTTSFTANGLKVTTLDLASAYAGGMGSGQGPSPGRSRMKAAVVETPGGNYFIRVLGPEKTVTKWDAAVEGFFKSMRYSS